MLAPLRSTFISLSLTALDALHGSGGGVTGRAFLFPCSEMEVSIFEFDVHIAEVAIGQGKALSVEEPAESWLSIAHEGAG